MSDMTLIEPKPEWHLYTSICVCVHPEWQSKFVIIQHFFALIPQFLTCRIQWSVCVLIQWLMARHCWLRCICVFCVLFHVFYVRIFTHPSVFVCILGVAVMVAPQVPLLVGVESRQQFCLQSGSSLERPPLQYTVCVGENLRDLHQEVAPQRSLPTRELPSLGILRWEWG